MAWGEAACREGETLPDAPVRRGGFEGMDNLSMTMPLQLPRRLLLALATVLLAVGAAAGARWLMQPALNGHLPYVTFLIGVIVVAYLENWVPSVAALTLGAVAGNYLFVAPFGHGAFSSAQDALALMLYLVAGAGCIGLSESQKRARARAEAAAVSLERGQEQVNEQREWLAVTLGSIGDAVVATDEHGRITSMNAVAAGLTGFTSGEACGRPVTEVLRLVDERTRGPMEDPVEKAIRESPQAGPVNHTILIARDGSEHPIDQSGAAIRDPSGRVRGTVLVFRDVSQRRHAEAAVHQSEERFRMMADSAPVLIWMAGVDKLCTYFNKPWIEFTGRALSDELGNGWIEGVHLEDLAGCLGTYGAAFDARRPFQMEYRLRRADGEYRWILDTGVPRYSPRGEFLGYIGTGIDITERKQAEETVLRQKEEMEDFVSILAHDLRHPVVSMQGLLSILKEELGDRLDPESSENLQMTLVECDRMKEIIAQISYISRLGHERVFPRRIALRDLVDDALAPFREAIREQSVELHVKCPDQEVVIAAAQIRQSLENLVRNALQYGCPRAGARVDIQCEVNPSWGYITVTDYGPGIAPRYHDRIFEVFRRLDPNGPVKGIGVGLTAVERLMRRSGGGVRLESNTGHGARFTLFFPCGPEKTRPGEARDPPRHDPQTGLTASHLPDTDRP